MAFGSDLQEMFYDAPKESEGGQKIADGIRVLIYVSKTGNVGAAAKYFKGLYATFEATYRRWQVPGNEKRNDGMHPRPQHRPASALATDKAVLGYWEVADLRPLVQPIVLSDLVVFGTNSKVTGPPRHPMFVNDKAV